MLHSSGGTLAPLHLGGRIDVVYRLVMVSIAEKIGSFILTILTFASNRTPPRRYVGR